MADLTLSADIDGFLQAADKSAARTALDLGTLATQSGTFSGTSSGTNTGDIAHWTEAVDTSAPNATIPAVSFTATNAATNADAVISPKGTGALLAAVPNNAASGGNKRGTNAVDLQTKRSLSFRVASGNGSVITGGIENVASAGNAVVSGGSSNSATGAWTVVSGGSSNAASGNGAVISGGDTNTASGTYSAIIGGSGNTASGSYASILGGSGGTTRGLYGVQARAASPFTGAGDAQRAAYLLRGATTNATTTEITLGGQSASATTRIVLPNNSTYKFRGQAVVRQSSTGDSKTWDISGTIKRGANAAATAILGTVSVTLKDADAGAATWALALDADTTNGSLRVQATGEAAKNLRWLVEIEALELTY